MTTVAARGGAGAASVAGASSSRAPDPPPSAAGVFGAGLDLAWDYGDVLVDEGVRLGLLGPREAARVWDRHLLNSAVVASLIPSGASVVDLGSGAGLPGIPLALARPDLRVVLLEPLLRRAEFLQRTLERLGLWGRVEVVRGRAEDVRGTLRAPVVTARAVAPLGRLAGWAMPLTTAGGQVLAIRGERAREELAESGGDLERAGVGHASVVTCGGDALALATTVVRLTRP